MKLISEIIYCVKPKDKSAFWDDVRKQFPESIGEREYDRFMEFPMNRYIIHDGLLVASFFGGCDARYIPQRGIYEEVDWL